MKRLIAILFIFISAMSLDAQTQKSLPVNIVDQVDPIKWCWAASITSIAQYYGNPVVLRDVLEIARNINSATFGLVDCHNEPCPLCHHDNVMIGASGSGSISEVLTQLGLTNVAAGGYYPVNYSLRAPLNSDQVKWNINQGRPILATWQNKNNSGGHAVVINGYSGTNISYMNPLDLYGYESEVFDYFVESPSKYWYGTAQLTIDPPPPCTLIPNIIGPSMVCTSDYTFTVNNYCPGSIISWSVSSGLLQKVSSSGNTAVFRGVANASGPGLIQATVTTPFGQVLNTTYPVWVGVPVISNVSGPGYNQVGAYAGYSATVSDINANVTSFNWTLIPGIFNNYFNPGYNCYITWNRAGQYVLQVNAQNNCPGTSATYYYPISVANRSYLSISPNPATDNVQVSIMKPQNTLSASDTTSITPKLVTISSQDLVTTYTIKIYNPFGTLFYSTRKSGDTFTIPVNNIKNGTYIIEANDGKQSYTQQLIIKH